jgi:light-regulated signal transduction histidine kinase (bacteriophytochrome)
VTELKKGEEALRRANLELEQFAYAAAHDLQEPLRNVGLATQILASRYKGTFDPDAENLLQTSVEGALRMQAMVKDLLAYSRAVLLEEGAVLFADPNVVLALALKNLVVSIEEKQAQISWETLPNLRMSETHLLQLLQNLISNSLKYSGTEPPTIHIAATTRAGECVFLVQDNGLGIPPEYHQRAFGVFKRLHSREVPGTGIGLALCKRIVEHYGGRIWIESRVGEGTTVLFTVPVA